MRDTVIFSILRLTEQFRWAPITDDDPTACGKPQEYDASKEWKGKKVVLFSVPGAFDSVQFFLLLDRPCDCVV